MSMPSEEPTVAAAEGGARAAPRRRRHDPERRDRIVAACLDVIAEHGVAGTSTAGWLRRPMCRWAR